MAAQTKVKMAKREQKGLVVNDVTKRRSSEKENSVSFGTVRIHKITQGVDPPSSSQAPSEFSDSGLIETGLFSLETYEQFHRCSDKHLHRTQPHLIKASKANRRDVQTQFSTKLATACNAKGFRDRKKEREDFLELLIKNDHAPHQSITRSP
jgi:hypothetical protein